MKVLDKEVFFQSPGLGTVLYGTSYYTRARGADKVRMKMIETRSDLVDAAERSFSADNGRTWSPPERVSTSWDTPDGKIRRFLFPGFVDPERDLLLTMVLEGKLATDDPSEGMFTYYLRYEVSRDGGRTAMVDDPVIGEGNFTAENPFDGVHIGKNGIMMGDASCLTIRTRQGRLLVPVQISPIGTDGKYYNPCGTTSYHDAAVLIGRWASGGRIIWNLSSRVVADPTRSTRGWIEPTLAEMPDGTILMVLRGSNELKNDLPGYRWFTTSKDGGQTWNPVQPWTFSTGEPFFSPSSCSQLLRHSNGNYYWLGNIVPENPCGNRPRYPFVIGQVDPKNYLLMRDTVSLIDDRLPDEHSDTTLSNFMAHEDRETGDILLFLARSYTTGSEPADHCTGNIFLFRISVASSTMSTINPLVTLKERTIMASSLWRAALELDSKQTHVSGHEATLQDAIRRGADMRIFTDFRHNEHLDTASSNPELVQEVSDFPTTYLIDNRWVAGIMTFRAPINPPEGFGPRVSMSFFLYNQNGLQAIARPFLDGQPAEGTLGPSPLDDHSQMPKYHQQDNWDALTNAPSSNFIYDFDRIRFLVRDDWQEVFTHDAQGRPTSGSLDALIDAFTAGCELKVALRGVCEGMGSDLDHEMFVQVGPGYYHTQRRLFSAGTRPTVRVRPSIPLRYESRNWDFGWLMPSSDGTVNLWLCDPYTLRFAKSSGRYALRWFVR
jgi:hypothetical protein